MCVVGANATPQQRLGAAPKPNLQNAIRKQPRGFARHNCDFPPPSLRPYAVPISLRGTSWAATLPHLAGRHTGGAVHA